MAKPSRKPIPQPPMARKNPQLRVIGGGSPTPKSSWSDSRKLIHRVLFLFFGIAAVLTYQAVNRPLDPMQTLQTFDLLHDILQREGFSRYLREKEELKKTVKQQLGRGNNDVKFAEAQSIAVYLFPDLLSNEDFEKPVAQEMWEPLQKAIESEPGTPKSRILFNEMRANIWNYENPDRSTPQLSSQARQVIRIYENLSAP